MELCDSRAWKLHGESPTCYTRAPCGWTSLLASNSCDRRCSNDWAGIILVVSSKHFTYEFTEALLERVTHAVHYFLHQSALNSEVDTSEVDIYNASNLYLSLIEYQNELTASLD